MGVPSRFFRWAAGKFGVVADRYRGDLPRGIVVVEFGTESGWQQEMVASDKKLTECGVAGAVLTDYYDRDADPFDLDASVWLGCRGMLDDVAKYREAYPHLDPEDHWYLMLLDFAIGGGAVRHILQVMSMLLSTDYLVLPMRRRIVRWARSADFWRPAHERYWGRQPPDLVQKRIFLQETRLAWAAELGPLSGPDYRAGNSCAASRPPTATQFPMDLVDIAKAKALPKLAYATHKKLHAEVEAYARRRRREREIIEQAKEKWGITLMRWLVRNPHGGERPT